MIIQKMKSLSDWSNNKRYIGYKLSREKRYEEREKELNKS